MFYFVIISAVAVMITAYDKFASKYVKRARIPEVMLLAFSIAGGSIAMFVTMLTIRHKTRKYKFMVGIPVIIILQVIALLGAKKLSLL